MGLLKIVIDQEVHAPAQGPQQRPDRDQELGEELAHHHEVAIAMAPQLERKAQMRR
jgi:hypothetical protein